MKSKEISKRIEYIEKTFVVETEMMKKIAEYLNSVIDEKEISVYKLHQITGLSKPTIYNILRSQNSKKDYSLGSLLTLMRVLNIHLEFS